MRNCISSSRTCQEFQRVSWISLLMGSGWRTSRILRVHCGNVGRTGAERLQLTYLANTRLFCPNGLPTEPRSRSSMANRGNLWRILLIGSDGGTPKEAYPDSRSQVDPTWSADGEQVSVRPGSRCWGYTEKWISTFSISKRIRYPSSRPLKTCLPRDGRPTDNTLWQ